MTARSKVIDFPKPVSSGWEHHSLSRGGLTMVIKHTHPDHADEKERLERLQELKKICVSKVAVSRKAAKKSA